MVQRLRERAAQAESARSLPPETMRELHASGVMRALQPKRWGGMELEFITYFDVTMELARGCASTAWNVSQVLMHHYLLAMYDPTHAAGGLERGSRGDHRDRHRLPARAGAEGGRRIRDRRTMEFLELSST